MRRLNIELKMALLENGKTQRGISKATGINEVIMSMIAQGKYNPSDQQKEKIAAAIGVGVGEIFV